MLQYFYKLVEEKNDIHTYVAMYILSPKYVYVIKIIYFNVIVSDSIIMLTKI